VGPDGERDTVTVYGGEPPHNVNDHVSTSASGILTTLLRHRRLPRQQRRLGISPRASWLVVLGPEHARTIAEDGFARADVQPIRLRAARAAARPPQARRHVGMHDWPAWMNAVSDPATLMPQVRRPTTSTSSSPRLGQAPAVVRTARQPGRKPPIRIGRD